MQEPGARYQSDRALRRRWRVRATGHRSTRLAVLLSAAVALAGCGTAPSVNEQGDGRYTPEEVAQDVGLVGDDTGMSWTGPRGCQVSVIMTTKREVQSYMDAGDPVVTNRRGDVGFKFGPQPGCRKRLLAALAELE